MCWLFLEGSRAQCYTQLLHVFLQNVLKGAGSIQGQSVSHLCFDLIATQSQIGKNVPFPRAIVCIPLSSSTHSLGYPNNVTLFVCALVGDAVLGAGIGPSVLGDGVGCVVPDGGVGDAVPCGCNVQSVPYESFLPFKRPFEPFEPFPSFVSSLHLPPFDPFDPFDPFEPFGVF